MLFSFSFKVIKEEKAAIDDELEEGKSFLVRRLLKKWHTLLGPASKIWRKPKQVLFDFWTILVLSSFNIIVLIFAFCIYWVIAETEARTGSQSANYPHASFDWLSDNYHVMFSMRNEKPTAYIYIVILELVVL